MDKALIQPHDKELEESILSALIMHNGAYDEVSGILTEETFYYDNHKKIFSAISELNSRSQPIDILTITEQLRKRGELDEIGGMSAIVEITKNIPSHNIEFYSMVLKEKEVARDLINYSYGVQKNGFDPTADVGETLAEANAKLEKIQEKFIGKNDSGSIEDVSQKFFEDLRYRAEKFYAGESAGINTGLCELNNLTGGWQKGNLIIIAARPAQGKTSVSLKFVKSAAQSGIPVVFFTLEMSSIDVYKRIVLSEDKFNPAQFKSGDISEEAAERLKAVAERIRNLPIIIDDTASTTMQHIRSKCRLLKKRGKCGLIVIDYLQLINSAGKRDRSREQEVSEMSRAAKLMSKELDVPVILLSQLSRKVEERTDKKPMLSDLRESGAIEQDADIVGFIYRPECYNLSGAIPKYGEILIEKNRDGSTGKARFSHDGTMMNLFDYDDRGYSSIAPPPSRFEEDPMPF